ncbi:hypothetical protein [Nocardiopsis potens]|uniref:hypothetical protein n=1 Tax=Nocardiopsis potens TaxID=1246458 RepID=UPI000349C6A6|nr:hypothetical protein [Nocardiopsis potens]
MDHDGDRAPRTPAPDGPAQAPGGRRPAPGDGAPFSPEAEAGVCARVLGDRRHGL